MASAKSFPITANICTYNEEKTIANCLKSVIRNNPREIIVIDGGSTDAARANFESLGVKVLISDNKRFIITKTIWNREFEPTIYSHCRCR